MGASPIHTQIGMARVKVEHNDELGMARVKVEHNDE
jgi:hypothetical protein